MIFIQGFVCFLSLSLGWFVLKTIDEKVSPNYAWKINYNSKNCITLHIIWLKLCNCVHSNLKKKFKKQFLTKKLKNIVKTMKIH
jgi:hypothetical protein